MNNKLIPFDSPLMRYVSKTHPVVNDNLGLPSIIRIDKKDYKITCSIDRHHVRRHIANSLMTSLHNFSKEDSEMMSESYCEHKYNEYKKAVMEL